MTGAVPDGDGLLRVPVDAPAVAVFTTRLGGGSTGPYRGLNLGAATGDDPDRVRANRAELCATLGVDPRRVECLEQVHGDTVHRVPGARRGAFAAGTPGPGGDGLVTEVPDVPLVVLGADCVPVLVWNRERPAVAAAHAGWRGLLAGVVERTVEALGDAGMCAAAVGPAVGPCCYPVSAEIRAAFAERFGSDVVVGEAVDMAEGVRRALEAAGVASDRVWSAGLCTSCAPELLFSYRRDGARTGRQAGMVWGVSR